MLKNNEPYRYAKLEVVTPKLADCRRQAKLPPLKRSKPSQATEEVSPLEALYQRHGLPTCQTPSQWSVGERRALAAAEVTTFAESVHKPIAKEKRTRTTGQATK
jgi:hypothetical protein